MVCGQGVKIGDKISFKYFISYFRINKKREKMDSFYFS